MNNQTKTFSEADIVVGKILPKIQTMIKEIENA